MYSVRYSGSLKSRGAIIKESQEAPGVYDFPEYHIDRELNIIHFRGNVLRAPTLHNAGNIKRLMQPGT